MYVSLGETNLLVHCLPLHAFSMCVSLGEQFLVTTVVNSQSA